MRKEHTKYSSESWRKGSNAASVGSPVVDEERSERMKPGYRFGSRLRVSLALRYDTIYLRALKT